MYYLTFTLKLLASALAIACFSLSMPWVATGMLDSLWGDEEDDMA